MHYALCVRALGTNAVLDYWLSTTVSQDLLGDSTKDQLHRLPLCLLCRMPTMSSLIHLIVKNP